MLNEISIAHIGCICNFEIKKMKRLGQKSLTSSDFSEFLASRSGWLDILIPSYTGDSGYPN